MAKRMLVDSSCENIELELSGIWDAKTSAMEHMCGVIAMQFVVSSTGWGGGGGVTFTMHDQEHQFSFFPFFFPRSTKKKHPNMWTEY